MRTRVAASTLVGVALVALVALSSAAVALVVWTRTQDRARADNERGVQMAQEALQTSLGRLLATLRGADGLVGERGTVDMASFQAFARAVAVLPAAETLGLSEVVTARERAAFERRTGIRIRDFVRSGVSPPAGARSAYLPVVSVWPPTRQNARFLGLDLLSEPARRSTLRLAREERDAVFTDLVRFANGQVGIAAFKPLYRPSQQDGAPIGYVSASFSTRVLAEIFGALPTDLNVSVVSGNRAVYESPDPPAGGVARTLVLGGKRWTVTAEGADPSRAAPIAILVAGLTLAALLAAFTSSRITFERRLVRANEAEREARERSELLERHAANLAVASTRRDVAASTVADLAYAGIEIAAVHVLRGDLAEVLASTGARRDENAPWNPEPYTLDTENAAAEAMRTGEVVEIVSGSDYDERFPTRAEARRRQGVECVIAVPLRNTDGQVTGALVAASRERRWINRTLRLVLIGVAEQCALALERARLQAIEQESTRQSGILQQLAARLSAAILSAEVAEATVASLFEAFDADVCVVTTVGSDDLNVLTVTRRDAIEERHWATVPQGTSSPMTDAVATGRFVEAHGQQQIAGLDVEDAASELTGQGIASLSAVPLPAAAGSLAVAFRRIRVLGAADRELLDAIGQEVTQALERAMLFEAERDARQRAELMEQNAAHLAAASTAIDVARTTVEGFEAFGADVVFVWRLRDEATLEALASTELPPFARRTFDTYPIDRPGLVTDALREGELAVVGTAEEFDRTYPNLAGDRERLGFESMVAVPLRDASGGVVGALFAASRTRHWLNADRRQLLLGVAEQTGVALERAMLFEAEREARRLAELLERNAAHLAAAVTLEDVAVSTVSDLERAGFRLSMIQVLGGQGIEVLAAAGLPTDVLDDHRTTSLDARAPSAEVIRTGQVVELASGLELDRTHPGFADLRRRIGVNTVLAVPLRAADRGVIGVLQVSATEEDWLTEGRRQVILGVAEQCGLALERAQLHAHAEATAAESAFIARLVDVLERSTTVSARVRRLTELLTEDRATFAAVHLVDEDQPRLVSVSGSRPVEAADDERWSRYVDEAVTAGHPVHPEEPEAGSAGSVGKSSMVILPLRARGHVIGALTIRTAADSRWEPAIPPAFAREIASRAAVRIDNALLYERERDVSHALQLGLLGGTLPTFEGVVITAAYRAGTEALEVGGDWYDAFALPSGSIALIVGDVVGHGLEAAVAMGQLRGAVSALAQTASPAALLDGLDAFVENVPSAATATLAYVELDPATGRMTYACAGHPPPLVVSADGVTRYLWDGRSAPLGSMLGDVRSEAVDRLEGGETIVLYTDGLIERRTESLDLGFERLAASTSLHAQTGVALADDVSDDLLRGQVQSDDVCVLTLHRVPVAAQTFDYSFPASPAELAGLRESLRSWLEEHAVDVETTRSTVLAVSEAAANAVEHAYRCDGVGIVDVEARLDDDWRLEISVRDTGAWREAGEDGDRGRGIPIIQAIVDEMTIDREDGATVVRMRRQASQEVAA